ncbi:hypothetical protein [Microbacterium sp. CGR1]|uniref:hypothetical protein n=1 Tax=Microbacterium sp. CGR1 TaxID=1696072 RepID=UPI003DA2545E
MTIMGKTKTTATLFNERIDGRLVALPRQITQPDIAAALDKLEALGEARREAFVIRDGSSAELAKAMTNEADDIAQAMFDDLSFVPDGVAESTLEAQAVARMAQTRLDGIVRARRLAVSELEAAVEAHGAKWGKSMREQAARAVLTLTTALDMATTAKAELDAAVGVLVLLKRREAGDEPNLNLAIGAGRHALPLEQAIEPLREAVVAASREVEGL